MNNFPKHFIAVWLSSVLLFAQSCIDQSVQLEKSKVQFTLSTTGTTSHGRVSDIDLPENALLRISIESSSGTSVFLNHEIKLLKIGSGYMTDALSFMPGTYAITDFMIVNDSEVLYATPKSGSQLSAFVMHSLPYNFSVTDNSVVNVSMQVIDVQQENPEAFGYASFKVNIVNTLSITVFTTKGGETSLTKATGEVRQGKKLIKTFSLDAAINTIAFEGDPDAVYTLSAYTDEEAKVKTFNFKELKKEIGAQPLKMTLEPALFLGVESSVDEDNETQDYFELALEGTGAVNIHWGDGYEGSGTMTFNGSHEYTMGAYTAIITGDLDQITNLYGFSYGTIILTITGLTNLTALKTFSPSWGAVPIKVDLSNCKNLETVFVEKSGAPYETFDLRTDFKLPDTHFIKEFTFDVPSFDTTRQNISAEELEVIVDNIYSNVVHRNIYDGTFYVYPVDAPSSETQQKLDLLKNVYNWSVVILKYDWEGGRAKSHLNARRDNWLRHKFPDNQHLSRSSKMAIAN